MLLSIVIPTHNRPAYLKQCLEALVTSINGRPDCEIIVVEDNSKIEIANVNRQLCDNMHIGYSYLEKNQGAAVARNRGIEKSKGEWVAFLDDDVCVENDWYGVCAKIISELPASMIGLEGKLTATGDGVWDSEVENLDGKAYCTCQIVYRKDILEHAGFFDEYFTSRYPTCEDHELAARALLRGEIAFNPFLRARHLPRTIRCGSYLRDSFKRIRSLLDAEFYFYRKHRDRYQIFRHAATFWGTYKNIALYHLYVSIRRRSLARLARHPIQCLTLVCASLLEQVAALCLFPKYVFKYIKNSRFSLWDYFYNQREHL